MCLRERIYIGGFVFLFLYNVATGIFNSMGDSRTPLYFLIGSSLGNIVLALIFVAVFHWDVAGVAWATFIAQGLSLIHIFYKPPPSAGENRRGCSKTAFSRSRRDTGAAAVLLWRHALVRCLYL